MRGAGSKRTRRRQPVSEKPRARTATSKGPVDEVTAYAKAVLGGKIIAGPHVRNSCRRHLQDLQEGPKRGLKWDIAAASRAINFFPDILRLAGGQFEGRPFHLHGSQAFIVGSIFGWKRQNGRRRFTRAFIEEGKGNGKSPLAAGVGLYMLLADKEARAEIYAAASKKDQAMVLFRDAVAMRQQSPRLRERLKPSGQNPVWQLTDMKTASFFKCLANEDGQSGPRPSCGLCDEIHEMSDDLVMSMIEAGFKWRRQPLLFMTTNSGHDRKTVCWEQHLHGVRVAAGTMTPDEAFTYVGEPIDDTTFSYVCALDKGDDPLEDPSCHIKANPLLGVTMTEEKLADAVKQAKLLPSKRNVVLRLNFCVWTDSETAWMSREALEAVLHDFEPRKEHAGKKACAGIDLSAAQDLTALAFIVHTGFRNMDRGDGQVERLPTFDAWIEAFTPADTIKERAARDQAPYQVWVDQGYLHAVPGSYIRKEYVAAHFASVASEVGIEWLAYDQYSFRDFADKLDDAGVTVRTIWHPQGGMRRAKAPEEEREAAKRAGQPEPPGLWMPGSLIEAEALILDQRIRVRRNPVLISACMSAAVVSEPLMNNRWLSKAKATNRIDPLISLLMAIGAATRVPPQVETESVYEKSEFFI